MSDITPPPPPAPEPTPGLSAEPTPAPPAYVAPPAYGAAPVAAKTNTMAIIALVLGIIGVSIGAVITGHIALSQIKKNGEGGRVLGLVGLILGYVGCLGWVIFWIAIIGLSIAAASCGYYC